MLPMMVHPALSPTVKTAPEDKSTQTKATRAAMTMAFSIAAEKKRKGRRTRVSEKERKEEEKEGARPNPIRARRRRRTRPRVQAASSARNGGPRGIELRLVFIFVRVGGGFVHRKRHQPHLQSRDPLRGRPRLHQPPGVYHRPPEREIIWN